MAACSDCIHRDVCDGHSTVGAEDCPHFGGQDYEAEYNKAVELNCMMSQEVRDMKDYFERQSRENEIMKAKLEMVYLIFGGRNHG